ncbi:MAG: methylase, partial [Ruminococcus sp.]|nr:methylase [Ruminococcus sp.]
MTVKEQKAAAKKFAEYWAGKGYEKGESQPFWLSLLRDVYGVGEPEKFISFEEQVHLDHTSFIDGYIHATKVMIEQKGLGKDLRKAIRQSDGTLLSPFGQAQRYMVNLPVSLHPRWVVTCNFEEFLIYDMEKPNCEPEQIFLKDLPKEYYRLNFLTDTGDENIKKETEVSLQAGELVGKMYEAIKKHYKNPDDPESL